MGIITRAEYMKDAINLHRLYYEQFVTEELKRWVLNNIGTAEELRDAHNQDKHLNNIGKSTLGGGHTKWQDAFGYNIKVMVEANECISYPTISTIVCTAKAAARVIIKETFHVEQ